MNDQIVQALQKIKNLPDGENILKDTKRFKSAIDDFLPGPGRDMVRMRMRTVEAVQLGIYTRLSNAKTSNDISAAARNAVEMMRDTGTDELTAKEVVGAFAALFTSEPVFTMEPGTQQPPSHVPVTSITGVPTMATAGKPLYLTGVVNPNNAKNKNIAWSIKSPGNTNATIAGSILNAPSAGNVIIAANIANGATAVTNYKEEFNISVNPVRSFKSIAIIAASAVVFLLLTWIIASTFKPAKFTNQTAKGIAAEILQGEKRNLQFGSYKWRVLDVQGDKALMITEDVIEQRPYNEDLANVAWETCHLRKYLNNEFLQKFSGEERGKIIETRISNPGNLWYGTPGGSDTMDKIFLLSLDEVDQYFGNSGDYQQKRRKDLENSKWITDRDGLYLSNTHDSDRLAKFNNEACWWWLRSPGSDSDDAATVDSDGSVDVEGLGVHFLDGGVRPAFWLNLKS